MAAKPFSIRLDPDLRAALEAEAKSADISASQFATRAIRRAIEQREVKRRAIEEALSESEKGVFVSQEAMNAWIDSWGTDAELPLPEPDIHP